MFSFLHTFVVTHFLVYLLYQVRKLATLPSWPPCISWDLQSINEQYIDTDSKNNIQDC